MKLTSTLGVLLLLLSLNAIARGVTPAYDRKWYCRTGGQCHVSCPNFDKDSISEEAYNARLKKFHEKCDSTYHRDFRCPRSGSMTEDLKYFFSGQYHRDSQAEQAYLQERENAFNERCNRGYHQDPDCPKYGEFEVPEEVLERKEKENERFRRWCQTGGHCGHLGA